jgi:hypothetical protein
VLSISVIEHTAFLLFETLAYKGTTTNVNELFLNIHSSDTSPTSFTFTATSSSGSPLLSVTTGQLYAHDIKFVYDSTAVDTFISLSGSGRVVMEYITVTATNSTGTVAPNAFISMSGGTVQLTQFSFIDLKSSGGVIRVTGGSNLLLDEVSVSNITFSVSGSLISGSSESSSVSMNIINSNFSSVSAPNLNGSIIRVNGSAASIYIYNDSFIGSSEYGNGGACYILGCPSIIITGTTFTGYTTNSTGWGGALFLGLGTWFSLTDVVFEECSAYYGGAILSESEISTERQMLNVQFLNNSVISGGNGNDLADNGGFGLLIYTPSFIRNTYSTSVTSSTVHNLFIILENINIDCLFSPLGCAEDPMFVSGVGVDSEVCGSSSIPCRSLGQVIKNLISNFDYNAEVNVASGDYTDTIVSISNLTLLVSTSSSTRPSISLVSPVAGLFVYKRVYI